MSEKQHSLIKGISILTIAGLICKVIGVLYKIPLARTIGPLGMGVYHQVFPTYNLLLTISSVGIPVAISRMVAHYMVLDSRRNAKRVFSISLRILASLGIIGTLMMALGRNVFAGVKGTKEASLGYLALAPSLLFVCMMSAYRGYMQGRRRMTPTAVSQLIEQVGKVVVAMPLAAVFMRKSGFAAGAAGALLGTSIAEAAALIYMVIDQRRNRLTIREGDASVPVGQSKLALKLFSISLPITIGACIVPIAAEVDSMMLVKLMSVYMEKQQAVIRYGVYTGLVFPLINVPTALAMATAANLVPAISGAVTKNNAVLVQKEANTGLKVASLIGMPSSVGMSMLAGPIIVLLFRGKEYTAQQLALGGSLLTVSSLTIWLFTLVQVTTGILQGLKKQRIPMYTLIAGVAAKIVLNYTLVRYPQINITGAPFASLLCYTVSLMPNLYYCKKYSGMKIDWMELLVRPGAATLCMALFLYVWNRLVGGALHRHVMGLMLTVTLAAVVFFLAGWAVGAVHPEKLMKRFRRKAE